MTDAASVSQRSGRSEALSLAQSEPAPRKRRSSSVTRPRRSSSKPPSSRPRRGMLKKSLSLSSVMSPTHQSGEGNLQAQQKPKSSERGRQRRSSKKSAPMSDKSERRRSKSATHISERRRSKSASAKTDRHRSKSAQPRKRASSKLRKTRSSGAKNDAVKKRSSAPSSTTTKDIRTSTHSGGSGGRRRKPVATEESEEPLPPRTISHGSCSSGGRRRRKSTAAATEGSEEQLPPRSTSHGSSMSRPRSVSAGPPTTRRSGRRRTTTAKVVHCPSAENTTEDSSEQGMTQSEVTHRTSRSSRNSAPTASSLHQSFSALNESQVIQQSSRPKKRRDAAKRKSSRATTGWLREGGGKGHKNVPNLDASCPGGRRRPSRSNAVTIKEHDQLLQMSVSEFGHVNVEVSAAADPLTLSPDGGGPKNIYALGILSPAHLEKQPDAKTTTATMTTQEVVKVQFIQSGGKVIQLNSNNKSSTKDHSGNTADVSATPLKKPKKKLHKFLLGMTPKPVKNKLLPSKYQTFSGDDTDDNDDDVNTFGIGDVMDTDDEMDEIASRTSSKSDNSQSIMRRSSESLEEPLSHWDEVDAAIPILQL